LSIRFSSKFGKLHIFLHVDASLQKVCSLIVNNWKGCAEMTIEEVVEAAQSGNVAAMNVLGDAFREEIKMRDAAEWYERAANLGDAYGKQMALYTWLIWASACEGTGAYDDAVTSWQSGYRMMMAVAEDTSISEEERNQALAHRPEILCGIGANLYFLQKKDEALEPLFRAAEERNLMARVVLGMTYQTNSTEQNWVEDFKRSIPLMESLFNASFKYEKSSQLDQKIVYLAHRMLAETYRKGLGGMNSNIERAYQCLLHLQSLNLSNFANEVAAELQKYHKGIFGGYKYRG